MKSSTESIMEKLDRANKNTLADLAVAIEQRDEAIRERNKTVADLIKQRDEALLDCECYKRFATRPEPSRLEIAAQFLTHHAITNALALEWADGLIAAAKEVK